MSIDQHPKDIFQTMIASGPVIIKEINGIKKTLLVKQGDKPTKELKWKFCGGRLASGLKLKANAIKRAKEEAGVDIKIIKPLSPMILWNETPEVESNKPEAIVLIHYLANTESEPKAGEPVSAIEWFDVNNLPEDCAPNVKPLVEEAVS